MHELKLGDGINGFGDDVSWLLDQQRSMTQDDSREEKKDDRDTTEMVVDNKIKKEAEE